MIAEPNRSWLLATLSAFTFALPIFLLAPSFIFYSNPHDVSLEFGTLLLSAAIFTLATVVVVATICFFARSCYIAAGLGIAITAKLYFFPSFVPLLDGEEIFAKFGSVPGIWSIASLIVLVVAGVVLARRLSPGALAFIAATFLIMGLQPLLNSKSWSFDWPSLNPENRLEPQSTEARMFEFSRDGDVMVVLLDAVQSDVFAEVLHEHPEYQEAFSGFTYFWNSVGRAPTTLMSMLPIYSGTPYGGGSVSARYDDLRNDSIFADFEKRGYDSALVGISIFGCPAAACISTSKLVRVGELESDLSEYLELLELGLMRVFPTFLQESWYNRGGGRLRAFLHNVPRNRAQRSVAAIRSLAAELSVSNHAPRLKVFHFLGAHPPITLNSRCGLVVVKGKPRNAYKDLVECNVRSLVELLSALKEAGVYNNLTIALISDHGETTQRQTEILGPFLGTVPLLSHRRGRFNPLFAVKIPGDNQPFRLSAAPVQISDLRATLCGQVLGCEYNVPGENVFRLEEDASRKRCFIDFRLWQTDHRKLDGMPAEAYQKFCVQGLLVDADYDPSGLAPRDKFR